MEYGPVEANEVRELSPFDPARDHSAHLSRRMYNIVMGGLVMLGFVVIALGAAFASTPAFLFAVIDNYLAVTIGSCVASIAGVVVINLGMKREGFGMALAGYALVVCSIGLTTGLILPLYDLPSIANAAVGTAIIALLFTLLGASYPQVFARIQGVAVVSLLALLVVSIVGGLMGMPLGWIDYAIILVFCGFIGYDTYRAQQCEPTVKMAIFNAVQIWLDLVNVFIRILSIVGNRD